MNFVFTGELNQQYQEPHIDNLLHKFASKQQVVLNAPTGSGKTVMATKFICDYLAENPATVFLWLCPGAGGLQVQSQESFEKFTQGNGTGDLAAFVADTNPAGKVFFINWDKLNRDDNIVNRDGEKVNLSNRIEFCHANDLPIFVVIDEEHKYQTTANNFVDYVKPIHVLRISATPLSGYEQEIMADEDAIGAGLIADGISINQGLREAVYANNNEDDDLLLIELANKKRKEILTEYQKRHLNIRPLVLIQFPNGKQEWITRVRTKLAEMGYGEDTGLTTQWFSGEYPDDKEQIKKLDGEYAFLLFKQAVATGWDCPRAKILVKLREGGSEAFNIQTIGRIRRMPERHHYNNEILDRCYIYTLDGRFTDGLKQTIGDSFNIKDYHKKDIEGVRLQSEYFKNGQDRYITDDKKVIEIIRNRMLRECDYNNNGKLERNELIRNDYIFDTMLHREAFFGVARTTDDIAKLDRIFAGSHEIDNRKDGFIIQDARRKIAAAGKLREDLGKKVLRILFGPVDNVLSGYGNNEYELQMKLVENLTLKEYNAFLVNNREKLMQVFSEANAAEYAQMDTAEIEEKEWMIPKTQEYKYDRRLDEEPYLDQNIFDKYGINILVDPNRSVTEIAFEQWCEKASSNVEWVYKNGDKGDMYFRIIYRTGFARNYFYPDYIVKLKSGNIWIVEAKGGKTKDGTSANIDKYAKHKFEALKEYAQNHEGINWCFARAVGANILVSNTEWAEEVMNREVWKAIKDVIV